MKSIKFSFFAVGLQLVFACAAFSQTQKATENKVTKAGWTVLFDGKTFKGWQKLAGDGWLIKDGELTAIPSTSPRQLDLLSGDQYDNFELVFEFKMAEKTNSGVKYLVSNNFPEQKGAYLGLEYQIVDEVNFKYPERGALRSLASLYDLIPADTNKTTSPLGKWNTAKIIVNQNHIEHWLNEKKVVEYNRNSAAFATLIADSKYKNLRNFGKAKAGYLLFQNEGSPVAFKNIKIRQLTNHPN
ncbi:MAG: hypothetical protein JWQ28_2652 [Pedobacter sp.]|jgi:hypothetical protein|nr:hypothetical protein [Pedobacter sp.]